MSVSWPSARTNYTLLTLAIITYLTLTYFTPTSGGATLGLSLLQINLLKLSITIPYLFTWTLAVYGVTILGKYLAVTHDHDNPFIPLLRALRCGLSWIIFGLIVTPLISATRAFLPDVMSAEPALTIIVNYLYVFPLLLGVWHIYKGARALPQKSGSRYHSDNIVKTVIVLILAVFYIFLAFTNPSREVALSASTPASYYLPDPLIVLTIIIPVCVTWWLGFSAAFRLSDTLPHITQANLFKAMTNLLYGIWAVIFTSILLQALLSLGTSRLLGIGIGLLLVLVYVFVLLQGFGYFLLAMGLKRLNNIKNTAEML